MTAKPHSFNVLLNIGEYLKLTELARALDCSRGRALRVALRGAHAMKCDHIPTCANGQSCYVPQMHPIPPPPPPTPTQQELAPDGPVPA